MASSRYSRSRGSFNRSVSDISLACRQIIGAPAFFSTVWGWIKRWFDPVTVSKIFILSSAEVLPTLTAFIDPENIPMQYGGKLEFSWCDPPRLDPKIRSLATWEDGFVEFPKGPLYWVAVDGGKRLECLARGSVNRKVRNEKVCSIPVAFPEGESEHVEREKEEEQAPVATNGHAVESAAAPADGPAAQDGATEENTAPETAPVVVEKNPDETPVVDIQGVQNLSLRDPDEKMGNGDVSVSEKAGETDNVFNGKPVAVS